MKISDRPVKILFLTQSSSLVHFLAQSLDLSLIQKYQISATTRFLTSPEQLFSENYFLILVDLNQLKPRGNFETTELLKKLNFFGCTVLVSEDRELLGPLQHFSNLPEHWLKVCDVANIENTFADAIKKRRLASLVSARGHDIIQKRRVGRPKILIVEDNLDFQEILVQSLASLEVSVKVTSNGRQALESILVENFDLVVCDMFIPFASGVDIFLELQKISPKTKFVFMTGQPSGDFSQSADLNLTIFQKPFKILDLISHIQNELSV